MNTGSHLFSMCRIHKASYLGAANALPLQFTCATKGVSYAIQFVSAPVIDTVQVTTVGGRSYLSSRSYGPRECGSNLPELISTARHSPKEREGLKRRASPGTQFSTQPRRARQLSLPRLIESLRRRRTRMAYSTLGKHTGAVILRLVSRPITLRSSSARNMMSWTPSSRN